MCVPSPRPLHSREPFPGCALRRRPPRTALSPPGPDLAHALYTHLATRQDAGAFNQPLSFDTSKVTTMEGMFYVRPPTPTSSRERLLTGYDRPLLTGYDRPPPHPRCKRCSRSLPTPRSA